MASSCAKDTLTNHNQIAKPPKSDPSIESKTEPKPSLKGKISSFCSFHYQNLTDDGKIFHYASSLSFYNILSIIPLFLVFVSIFANLPVFKGQVKAFKELVLSNMLPDNTLEISSLIDGFLSNGIEMGLVGFLVALVSSFFLFRNFDDISARIFAAKKRSIFDSFIIYWLFITLVPLFFVSSVYLSGMVYGAHWPSFSNVSKLVSMAVTWLVFALVFRISANKPIGVLVLGTSSFFGALAWFCFKSLFVYYMVYNQFYKNIYGSISIVMFVFLWIYVSWLVVLVFMRLCKYLSDRFPRG